MSRTGRAARMPMTLERQKDKTQATENTEEHRNLSVKITAKNAIHRKHMKVIYLPLCTEIVCCEADDDAAEVVCYVRDKEGKFPRRRKPNKTKLFIPRLKIVDMREEKNNRYSGIEQMYYCDRDDGYNFLIKNKCGELVGIESIVAIPTS